MTNEAAPVQSSKNSAEMRVRRYLNDAGWMIQGDNAKHAQYFEWCNIWIAFAIQTHRDARESILERAR